jgi:hypothetical protein
VHILRAVLREYPQIRESLLHLSEQISGNAAQQGLFLDVNPFWWAAYCLDKAGVDPLQPDVVAQQAFMSTIVAGDPPPPGIGDFSREYRSAGIATDWFFPQRRYRDKPFLARIIGRANPVGDGRWSQLLAAARESPVPTVVDIRTEARLLARPGDLLAAPGGATGTLGGFLRDGPTGRVFAVTCGHVITAGTAMAGAGPLGPCLHSRPPVLLPTGAVCYAGCATKAEQDLALIDVGGRAVANTCVSTASYVYSHQLVEMVGAVSGVKRYEVGGTALSHEVGGACWGGVFELRLRHSPGILHSNLALLATSPPRNGDSGSWVIDGTQWCGMVTAADNLCGYALEADSILAKAKADWGLNLLLA